MRERKGIQIIMNSETRQRIFSSYHEASRDLGISIGRVERLIDGNLPFFHDDIEWRLDLLIEEDTCRLINHQKKH